MFAICGLALVALAPTAFGQRNVDAELQTGLTDGASERAQTYDIVSIKPTRTGDSGGMATLPNGFVWRNANLWLLIQGAYGIIMDSQVTGLPGWAKSESYDIEARVDAATAERWKTAKPGERSVEEEQMMRSILADRCKFKAHQELRELSVYDLVIAKGGLKMKEAPQGEVSGEEMTGVGRMKAQAVQADLIAEAFTRTLGRIIVDKTGLGDRKFDFELKWTSDNQPAADTVDAAPSLLTALQEQLGLKIVSSKGPVKVLTIDHMDRPSPN